VAAVGIATGSSVLLNSLCQREHDLDKLDMDGAITFAISEGKEDAMDLLQP
jgi:hypothetical protein